MDDSEVEEKVVLPVPQETEEEEMLLDHLAEIRRCTEWIRSKIQSTEKMEKISRYSTLTVMSISIILSMLPAFVEALKDNWYQVPCTFFSMLCLLLDIYWDKSDFGGGLAKCFHIQEKLNNTRESILRHSGGKKPNMEYVKRMGEKLSLIKLAAGINESV